MHTRAVSLLGMAVFYCGLAVFAQEAVFPGADETTPSRSEYFSWINNTNEGATEAQTLANLDFFQWLHDEYGMKLDIYAFDAGAIDGKRFYGRVDSDRFQAQFPNGFGPMYEKAKAMGTRLGVWGGPDGFGNTAEEEAARTDQMMSLCRDFEFALFKFDAVCGALRPDREDAFIRMMIQCREHSPDLILLNHRLGLERAQAHATTFLWEGKETYIDVFSANSFTASHHRADALARGLVPDLQRLTEDHGVCLSSCLDFWEDDLVLQAFNRCLILAPQLYGNPWFLKDDEFPRMARIFNLHRKYGELLVKGMVLPQDRFGPSAVSRGDGSTRLITLRNLTWEPMTCSIPLNEEVGLTARGRVHCRRFHPLERILGDFDYGANLEVEVMPFRACLLLVTTAPCDEPGVMGCDYEVVRHVPGKSVLIDLKGRSGTEEVVTLAGSQNFQRARLGSEDVSALLRGESLEVAFAGAALKKPWHRKLADLEVCEIPADGEALYEATVFAADSNALEVRCLDRSGPTAVPQVKAARDAFFQQSVFRERGIWDRNLFDGDPHTGFWPCRRYRADQRVKGGCFRLDLGAVTDADRIVVQVPDEYSLQPLLRDEGYHVEVSADLKSWQRLTYLAGSPVAVDRAGVGMAVDQAGVSMAADQAGVSMAADQAGVSMAADQAGVSKAADQAGVSMAIDLPGPVRFLRFSYYPDRICEVEGYKDGHALPREGWRASNLFAPASSMRPVKAWRTEIVIDEFVKGSYLCIAVEGRHGVEGAYAALKVKGRFVGCPDRAPSFPSNTWEYVNARMDRNYTYYVPVTPDMIGEPVEVFVLAYEKNLTELQPRVWITAHPAPFETKRLELRRKGKT